MQQKEILKEKERPFKGNKRKAKHELHEMTRGNWNVTRDANAEAIINTATQA